MSIMHAKERLYLTACRTALVREGDPTAASLYAGPGDEIPASAVERFGLVDGTIADGIVAIIDEIEGGLLRARLFQAGELFVAGLTFTDQFRAIGADEIDEGQLLAILKEPALDVEAALIGDPSPGWVPFPGRAEAIFEFQERVDADIAAGRPHLMVGDDTAEKMKLLAALSEKQAPPPPNKERAPGSDKEKKPDSGSGTKGDASNGDVAAPGDVVADDLTRVKFIGATSAAALAKAGITRIVQLSAIDVANPPAIEGMGARTNWAGIVTSAAELLAADAAQDSGAGDGGGAPAAVAAADQTGA